MKQLKDFPTEELIQELRYRGYLRVLWQKEDVLEAIGHISKNRHIEDDKAYNSEHLNGICLWIENHWSADGGLNWDIIREHAINYFINLKK